MQKINHWTLLYMIKHRIKSKTFLKSIWLFPSLLLFLVFVLTLLKISGTSIGVYHEIFYGKSVKDSSLIFGKPKSIRSDEWIVNTQKTISQSANNYPKVNANIGLGENERLINDVPTRDWSVLFKPHNLGFFVIPFENAFSLKWWSMSYLLVISSYFFVLLFLPRRYLLAALLSLAFLFSPFFQWWYAYGTLASVYYCLFGAVIYTKILSSKSKYEAGLWSLLLTYVATSFMLILYPPFQIPCALVALAFAIGYFLDNKNKIDKKLLKFNLLSIFGAILLSLLVVFKFIGDNQSTVTAITNSVYPGVRVIKSGNYNLLHLLASNLSPVFQKISMARNYFFPALGSTNQSEASNFILISPFFIILTVYLSVKNKIKINYTFISFFIITIIMLAWMFVPGLNLLGKISLLNKAAPERTLIGIGLLNFIFIIGFINYYSQCRDKLSRNITIALSLSLTIFYLLLNFYIMTIAPGFINYKFGVLLAIPYTLIIFLFLEKRFNIAASALLLFSLSSTFYINPIYQGLSVVTKSPLSLSIKDIGKSSDKKWISEGLLLGSFVSINGEGSLSGVYTYPQEDIWKDEFSSQKDTYNRYAHVGFNLDRRKDILIDPYLKLNGADNFTVNIEPCDEFIQKNNIGFYITINKFDEGSVPCATLIKTININPPDTVYIYSLKIDI